MALIEGSCFISSSHKSKSMLPCTSMSTNFGLAFAYKMELEVAKKELGVVSTVSSSLSNTREDK